jgi:antitoxin (DNA-binding transcriptional repressor) of toxin-antitoxin stability system
MSIVIKDKDVKANLSKLFKAAKDGKEVIITSGDVAFAKLVPIGASARERKPGSMPDLLSLPNEFYEPLSGDELAPWE